MVAPLKQPKYIYHVTVTNVDTGEVVVDREFSKLNWMYRYLDDYTDLTPTAKVAFLKGVKKDGVSKLHRTYRRYTFYNIEATRKDFASVQDKPA